MKLVNNILKDSEPVKSLSDYLALVNKIKSNFQNSLWFRGHTRDEYELLPNIYRKEYKINGEYSFKTETDSFKDFRRLSKLSSFNDREIYLLMQHYGTPTRLLDWTESSLVGLFFALNKKNLKNPAVWVLSPYEFNLRLHQNIGIPFFGKNTHDKVLNYFEASKMQENKIPEFPFAITPDYIDQRIINQKGCFTIFGINQTPIEKLQELYPNYLAKIEIDDKYGNEIFNELLITGIDFYTVYPDLEGLSKKIKHKHFNNY